MRAWRPWSRCDAVRGEARGLDTLGCCLAFACLMSGVLVLFVGEAGPAALRRARNAAARCAGAVERRRVLSSAARSADEEGGANANANANANAEAHAVLMRAARDAHAAVRRVERDGNCGMRASCAWRRGRVAAGALACVAVACGLALAVLAHATQARARAAYGAAACPGADFVSARSCLRRVGVFCALAVIGGVLAAVLAPDASAERAKAADALRTGTDVFCGHAAPAADAS